MMQRISVNLLSTITLYCAIVNTAHSDTYISLSERLDRPHDGYCLDVVGSGPHVRIDMPLTAHNCKGPQPYDDEIVELREDGTLFFKAYNGCVTVMGNNQHALPGNALMLKRCGEESPFLNSPKFQKFYFNAASQLQLKESDLCIVAGERSATTYSDDHKWRSLFMHPCKTALAELSSWAVRKAGNHE